MVKEKKGKLWHGVFLGKIIREGKLKRKKKIKLRSLCNPSRGSTMSIQLVSKKNNKKNTKWETADRKSS